MSAYICSVDHFKVLAVFASHRRCDWCDWRVDPRYIKGLTHPEAAKRGIENLTQSEIATLYADTLYQENIRSVRERYPDDAWDELPGPTVKPAHLIVDRMDFEHRKYRLGPVAILKMCDGLEYQACETEDWEQTAAFRLLQAIRRATIRALPGYEDAPWDYCADEAKAA